jgi:hypothetical protein
VVAFLLATTLVMLLAGNVIDNNERGTPFTNYNGMSDLFVTSK